MVYLSKDSLPIQVLTGPGVGQHVSHVTDNDNKIIRHGRTIRQARFGA